jgi:uncharacterized cupin superfamily protein
MADIVYPGQVTGGALNATALPSNTDLVLYKGDYVEILLTLKDSLGAPLNLTGATPKAQLKSDYSDREPKEFTCTVTAAEEGKVRIFLPSSATSELLPGSYIWDFQITAGDGNTRTYLAGDVTVYNEVTT